MNVTHLAMRVNMCVRVSVFSPFIITFSYLNHFIDSPKNIVQITTKHTSMINALH